MRWREMGDGEKVGGVVRLAILRCGCGGLEGSRMCEMLNEGMVVLPQNQGVCWCL